MSMYISFYNSMLNNARLHELCFILEQKVAQKLVQH